MPRFDVTIVERLILRDQAILSIEACNAETAARIVLSGVSDDTSGGFRTITLPDGTTASLDPDTVEDTDILAEVRASGSEDLILTCGASDFFRTDRDMRRDLDGILARAILDTRYPESHDAARRLRVWLKEHDA